MDRLEALAVELRDGVPGWLLVLGAAAGAALVIGLVAWSAGSLDPGAVDLGSWRWRALRII
jgi:hypothetical protein